jgi:hypothetical protein
MVAMTSLFVPVYAQIGTNTTTSEIPLSEAAKQIITKAQNECSTETSALVPFLCVNVIHESPGIVVLNGELLVSSTSGLAEDNPFIWRAVDGFSGQGYNIESISLAGQGSQGNPHNILIVMSK